MTQKYYDYQHIDTILNECVNLIKVYEKLNISNLRYDVVPTLDFECKDQAHCYEIAIQRMWDKNYQVSISIRSQKKYDVYKISKIDYSIEFSHSRNLEECSEKLMTNIVDVDVNVHFGGYRVYYDQDKKSEFIKLEHYVDERGCVCFVGFEDRQVILEYLGLDGLKRKLMYFAEKYIELQVKLSCPKCNEGWLDIVDQECYENEVVKEDDFGRSKIEIEHLIYRELECKCCGCRMGRYLEQE